MRELARLTLDAKQIRAAIEEAVANRAVEAGEEAVAINVPDDLNIIVAIRRKRAPRRTKASTPA